MKKIICSIVVTTALMLGAAPTFAQEEAQGTQESGLKIAVIDMSTALLNSEVAKGVDAELQQETASDREKVSSLAEQAQTLQEQLQRDAEVLSESEQRRLVGDLQELQNQYQFLVEKIRTLVNERREQFQQTYAPNLVQAISDVVEEDDFDIVFRAEAVLFFDNVYDITARVTENLNEQQ